MKCMLQCARGDNSTFDDTAELFSINFVVQQCVCIVIPAGRFGQIGFTDHETPIDGQHRIFVIVPQKLNLPTAVQSIGKFIEGFEVFIVCDINKKSQVIQPLSRV